MPLNVLQLGPFPPPVGGISRNILAIRDEIRRRGHCCSIIATSRSSSVEDEPDVYHPRSAVELLKLIATIEFDVVHLHIGGDVTRRVLSMASAVALFGRGRSVLTLHSGAYPQTAEGKSANSRSARGLIFRRFTRIIAVNEKIAAVFERYGVVKDRIIVILPYSLSLPDESVKVPKDLRSFYSAHSPVLLAVGGLEPDYDPLFQIAAMEDILKEFPKAGLMIVGDGSLRAEVETAVSNSEYAEKIMLAGNIDHPVTLHLIKDAEILLRTTLFDGDAISVREALFLGTPVIATDNGMRPDGVNLMTSGNREELVAALKQCVKEGRSATNAAAGDTSNISAVVDLYEELSK